MTAMTMIRANDEATITAKRWLASAKRTGQGDTYAGKRRHARYTWVNPVTIEVMEGQHAGRAYYATTRDISAGGIGTRCRHRLDVMTLVCVIDEDGEAVFGRVRHCGEVLGAFLIGVEFADIPIPACLTRKSA
jgi:c-di-GMP-binding flagellar brake protein YcgR